MTASPTLTSAPRPNASTFALEVSRAAREAETLPLTVGQEVAVGFKRMHALPTPISSVRLISSSEHDSAALAKTALVRELAGHMHIEPIEYKRDAAEPERVRGLPVVAVGAEADLGGALKLLEQGARQVLAVIGPDPKVERMLIHVEPSSHGREAALAASASLARHLTVDVAMLVQDGENPVEGAGSFRHLLDLRNESLRHHGLDIRTETFQGGVVDAIRERLEASEEPTMLVIGLTSPERCSSLIDELRELIRKTPPSALLFVSGREERDARAAPAPAPVYAFAL
jgi:hypothetical protein